MEKAAEYSRSRRGGSGVEQGGGACAALGSWADQAPLCKNPTRVEEHTVALIRERSKHYWSVIAPVELFTVMGTLVSGVFVGPWTTAAAFEGSNSAP